MLLDSNVIIYAAQPEHPELREFIAKHEPAVSVISFVEVLGYPRLSAKERQHFEEFFAAARMLSVSDVVIKQATALRQIRKITLGDPLVAATALAHGLTLVTRNTADFDWITKLALLNPLEAE
jgi:predicted nucleic acid-binding protein